MSQNCRPRSSLVALLRADVHSSCEPAVRRTGKGLNEVSRYKGVWKAPPEVDRPRGQQSEGSPRALSRGPWSYQPSEEILFLTFGSAFFASCPLLLIMYLRYRPEAAHIGDLIWLRARPGSHNSPRLFDNDPSKITRVTFIGLRGTRDAKWNKQMIRRNGDDLNTRIFIKVASLKYLLISRAIC